MSIYSVVLCIALGQSMILLNWCWGWGWLAIRISRIVLYCVLYILKPEMALVGGFGGPPGGKMCIFGLCDNNMNGDGVKHRQPSIESRVTFGSSCIASFCIYLERYLVEHSRIRYQ